MVAHILSSLPICLHLAEPVLVNRAIQRLQVGLLTHLRVTLIRRSHLHVRQIEGLLICLVRCVHLALEIPRWRVTGVFMALYLLLQLILSNQVLVPRRVVVVGEELREQEVHVGALGTVRVRVLAFVQLL